MAEQLKQIITTGPDASHPLREQLPADSQSLLDQVANDTHKRLRGEGPHLRDAREHEFHTRLLAGKGVEWQDAQKLAVAWIIHLLFLSRPGNHDLAAASGVLLRRRCFTKSVTRASVSPVDWSMSLSLGCTARGSERRKHRIGGSDCRLLNVAPINHHGKGSMKP